MTREIRLPRLPPVAVTAMKPNAEERVPDGTRIRTPYTYRYAFWFTCIGVIAPLVALGVYIALFRATVEYLFCWAVAAAASWLTCSSSVEELFSYVALDADAVTICNFPRRSSIAWPEVATFSRDEESADRFARRAVAILRDGQRLRIEAIPSPESAKSKSRKSADALIEHLNQELVRRG